MKRWIFRATVVLAALASTGCWFNGIDYFGYTAITYATIMGLEPLISGLIGGV